jgi:two-component system response regulator EvgA
MRSIVIDDSGPVRARVAELLREAGVAVVGEAENGEQALRLVHELRPDVIVLDLHMPEMGGLDVLRALQCTTGCPRIVVLSNGEGESYRAECLRLGASTFLDKSKDLDAIVAAVIDEAPRTHR